MPSLSSSLTPGAGLVLGTLPPPSNTFTWFPESASPHTHTHTLLSIALLPSRPLLLSLQPLLSYLGLSASTPGPSSSCPILPFHSLSMEPQACWSHSPQTSQTQPTFNAMLISLPLPSLEMEYCSHCHPGPRARDLNPGFFPPFQSHSSPLPRPAGSSHRTFHPLTWTHSTASHQDICSDLIQLPGLPSPPLSSPLSPPEGSL